LPGLIKPIIWVLDIIIIICGASVSSLNEAGGMWFAWLVIVTALIIIFVMCVLILVGVWDRLPVNKAFLEFVISAVYAFLFVVVFIILVVAAASGRGNRGSAYGAGAFFTVCITAAFALNAWGHFTMWRSGTEGTTQTGGPGMGGHA